MVLRSSHERTFSSGANLGGFAADVPLVHKHFGSDRFVGVFKLIGELGKPTLCAARGHVLAGALGIALACDLIVASEGASFGTPEINMGAFPFMIMALIYRNVPRKKATEMLLLGERWSAHEALAAGIVNRVVPDEELDRTVAEWAGSWPRSRPVIMRLGKEAMRRQLDMPLDDALDYLRAQLTLAMSTEDIVEGVTAFFEKRDPVWKGADGHRAKHRRSKAGTARGRNGREGSPLRVAAGRWSRISRSAASRSAGGGGGEDRPPARSRTSSPPASAWRC